MQSHPKCRGGWHTRERGLLKLASTRKVCRRLEQAAMLIPARAGSQHLRQLQRRHPPRKRHWIFFRCWVVLMSPTAGAVNSTATVAPAISVLPRPRPSGTFCAPSQSGPTQTGHRHQDHLLAPKAAGCFARYVSPRRRSRSAMGITFLAAWCCHG